MNFANFDIYFLHLFKYLTDALFYFRFSELYDHLDRYYQISAPEADLFGNVDAIGLKMAYDKIDDENPKLSDVLKLYYERPDSENIPVKPTPEYYTFSNRWLIVCQFLNMITINGNTITWLPGAPNSTWSQGSVETHDPQHYFSFENKACLVEKMKNFILFWLNRIIYPTDTGLCMIWRKDPKENIITAFDKAAIAYPGSKTESAIFRTLVEYVLNNHLLPYLKTSLTNEQVGKQVV